MKTPIVLLALALMTIPFAYSKTTKTKAHTSNRKIASTPDVYDCTVSGWGQDTAKVTVKHDNVNVTGTLSVSKRTVTVSMLDGVDAGTSQVGVSFSPTGVAAANNNNPKMYMSTSFVTGSKSVTVIAQTDPALQIENAGWNFSCTKQGPATPPPSYKVSDSCTAYIYAAIDKKLPAKEFITGMSLDENDATLVNVDVTQRNKDDNFCDGAATVKIHDNNNGTCDVTDVVLPTNYDCG